MKLTTDEIIRIGHLCLHIAIDNNVRPYEIVTCYIVQYLE